MVCLVVVLLYFALAGAVYVTAQADCRAYDGLGLFRWSEMVGPSYKAPVEEFTWTPHGNRDGADGPDAVWDGLSGPVHAAQDDLRRQDEHYRGVVCVCADQMLIGVPLGAIAGYFRGWVDDVIVWFYTTLGTIPGISC
jgi:hypothetical protein